MDTYLITVCSTDTDRQSMGRGGNHVLQMFFKCALINDVPIHLNLYLIIPDNQWKGLLNLASSSTGPSYTFYCSLKVFFSGWLSKIVELFTIRKEFLQTQFQVFVYNSFKPVPMWKYIVSDSRIPQNVKYFLVF